MDQPASVINIPGVNSLEWNKGRMHMSDFIAAILCTRDHVGNGCCTTSPFGRGAIYGAVALGVSLMSFDHNCRSRPIHPRQAGGIVFVFQCSPGIRNEICPFLVRQHENTKQSIRKHYSLDVPKYRYETGHEYRQAHGLHHNPDKLFQTATANQCPSSSDRTGCLATNSSSNGAAGHLTHPEPLLV